MIGDHMFGRRPTAAARLDALKSLQARLDQLLAGRVDLRVLEAGCGARTPLSYPVEAHVVGIDKDEIALARNQRVDEPVIADLETYALADGSFDLIVSWYVFEHLAKPAVVLSRLARALRDGGLMAVAVPNVWSPKALVAKLTPYRFHVWVWRRVLGDPLAGTPGHDPHPTTLRLSIAPSRLQRLATQNGLEVVHVGWFEDDRQRTLRRRVGLSGKAWRAIEIGVSVVSAGVIDAARTEAVLVFRK